MSLKRRIRNVRIQLDQLLEDAEIAAGQVDDLSQFSASLQQFAQKDNVPVEDIEMLSRINYQGRQPKAIWEWRVIYSVIKSTLE